MLHIILGILKVIGILLGFLFLFLLAMLLAVLFCSVRYQVQAEKQPNRTEGKVKISWLFHIVSVAFSIDSSRKAFLSIRLFGIRLPVPGKKKVRKGHSRKGAKQKKQKRNDKPQNDDVPTEVSEEVMDLTEEVSEKVKEGVSETIDVTEALILEPDDTTEAPILKAEHTAQRPISEIHEGSFWQKIRNFIFNIYRKIRTLFAFLISLPEKIRQTVKGFQRLWAKIRSMAAKPGQILNLMEELEAREVFGNAAGYVTYLLRHYKPRRIKGFLHFGTGDPMSTAYLTGILYIILPAKAEDFSVQPSFDEAVFETQISFHGRIRMCHLVYAAWKAFRDKKLRRIIRYIKKRG